LHGPLQIALIAAPWNGKHGWLLDILPGVRGRGVPRTTAPQIHPGIAGYLGDPSIDNLRTLGCQPTKEVKTHEHPRNTPTEAGAGRTRRPCGGGADGHLGGSGLGPRSWISWYWIYPGWVGQPRHGYWCVLVIEISSLHVLRTFIEVGNTGHPGAPYTETAGQTVIHLTFILSAIAIAFVDRLGQFALARTQPSGAGRVAPRNGRQARAGGAFPPARGLA